MLVHMVARMRRCVGRSVLAIRTCRSPRELHRQEYQHHNKKPTAHGSEVYQPRLCPQVLGAQA
jgi:hypothetical protein